MVYDVLTQLPLATLAVWSTVTILQLARRRLRTLTEMAFLVGAASWAGYAGFDWLVFHAQDEATAFLLAKASLTCVTLAAFFFLLFTKLFLTKPQRGDLLLLGPLGLALALTWGGMVVTMRGPVPWGWTAVFDVPLFLVWLLYVVAYAAAGVWFTYRTYLVVRENSESLGLRLFGILISFLTALVLGLGTNTVFHSLDIAMMPLFSTALVFPGIITLYVLVPLTRDRISSVIRRWKSTRYKVLGGYLIYQNGTLIASRTTLVDPGMDEDIFSATLDAIQTFMRTSFPLLLGKSLRRIEHGDVNILIERGRYSYLALLIQGEDPDTLWIKMRESVERFEAGNEPELTDWSGAPDDLQRVEETLEDLFTEAVVFS